MSRTQEAISKNMSKIHSSDTSIEVRLRKALWHKGYRYRKNYKVLPGSPDIALTKYKIAIFCDSEFFHGVYSNKTISHDTQRTTIYSMILDYKGTKY